MRALAGLLIGLTMCVPARSEAQVLQRPDRAATEPKETNAWHRLTFSATTLGSYDDNVTGEQRTVDPTEPQRSGYTGFVDSSLRFDQAKGSQTFGAVGRAYLTTFRNIGLTPIYGGDLQANFSTALGRRHRLDMRQDVRNEPFYALGGYSGLRQDMDPGALPDANPLNGHTARRSWAAASRLDVSSQWSPRNSVGMSVGYDMRDFSDNLGDSRATSAAVSYSRNVGRRSSVRTSYSYLDTKFLEPTGSVPSLTHALEGGASLERRFSPTRRMVVSFGGGGVHLQTVDRITREDFEFVAPTGYAVVRLDWARTWNLSADYRRFVANLDGLSSEAFTTDASVVRLGGFVARRLEAAFSVAYSDGNSSSGRSGAFETYTGTSQMRLELARNWSAVISHSYYRYSLRDVLPIVQRVPAQLNRNAIRVGLALNIPVIEPRAERDRPDRD